MAAIQVKNVPDELHQRLREAAGGENMTLSDFILSVLEREVDRPQTFDEWYAEGEPIEVKGDYDVVALIREGREERDRQILDAIDRNRRIRRGRDTDQEP